MSDVQTTSPARKRSPSYPAINLEEAIRRVRQLWEKQHEYPTPLTTAFGIWGYESTAGNANLVVAALRKFGLVDYEGSGQSRKVKTTPLAVQILDHPNEATRKVAIQEAALLPPIHQELWQQYGAKLPTDDHLRWELEQERNFSKSGASDFIPEYRRTLSFAGLTGGDTVVPQAETEDGADDNLPNTDQSQDLARVYREPGYSPKDPSVTTIPVLLPGGDQVTIQGRFPITEAAWNQMMAVLNAMKLGMVKEDAPERFKPDEGPLTLP